MHRGSHFRKPLTMQLLNLIGLPWNRFRIEAVLWLLTRPRHGRLHQTLHLVPWLVVHRLRP